MALINSSKWPPISVANPVLRLSASSSDICVFANCASIATLSGSTVFAAACASAACACAACASFIWVNSSCCWSCSNLANLCSLSAFFSSLSFNRKSLLAFFNLLLNSSSFILISRSFVLLASLSSAVFGVFWFVISDCIASRSFSNSSTFSCWELCSCFILVSCCVFSVNFLLFFSSSSSTCLSDVWFMVWFTTCGLNLLTARFNSSILLFKSLLNVSNSLFTSIYLAFNSLTCVIISSEIGSWESLLSSIILSFTLFNSFLFCVISSLIVLILVTNLGLLPTTPWWLSLRWLIISSTHVVLAEDSSWNLVKSLVNAFFNSSHALCTSFKFLPVLNAFSKQAKYELRESIKLRDAIFLCCTFLSKSSRNLSISSLIWSKLLLSVFIANLVDNSLTCLTCNNFNSVSNCFSFLESSSCNWIICSLILFTASVASFSFCSCNLSACWALFHACNAISSTSFETAATLDDTCSSESWVGSTKASTSFFTAFIWRLSSELSGDLLSISDKVFFSL